MPAQFNCLLVYNIYYKREAILSNKPIKYRQKKTHSEERLQIMAERQRPRNKTKACTQQRVNDIKLREDLRKIAKLERKYFLPLARGVFFCGRKCCCWWHRLRNQSQRLNFDGRYFEADIRREIKKLTSVQATARRPKPVERANDFLSKCFFFCFFFCWCLSNKRSHNNNATDCTNPSNQPARLFERKNVTEKNKYSKYEQTMCLATNKSQFSIWTNYEKNRLALNLRPFNLFDYSAKGHNILCMIVHQQFSRWLVIIFRRKIDQFSEFSSFLSF